MPRGKKFDYEEAVRLRLLSCLPDADVCERLGIHPKTLQAFIRTFEYCRDRKVDKVVSSLESGTFEIGQVKWCYDYLNAEIPRAVLDVDERMAEAKRNKILQKLAASAAVTEAPVLAPVSNPAPAAAIDPVYLIRILENQSKQIELTQSLIDVVIPGWTQEIRKANNANADMIFKQLKTLDEKVEKISCRMKKFNGS